MGNKLVAMLRDALREAKKERDEAGRSEAGRHLALTVTHLEDALLRAMLACRLDGLVLLPAQETDVAKRER